MGRRFSRRSLMAGVSLFCLASSLRPASARAQSNRYAEDWESLQKVIGWASGTWDLVNGVKTAVEFLTGIDSPPGPPSIEEIEKVVIDALLDVKVEGLKEQVTSIVRSFRELQRLAADGSMMTTDLGRIILGNGFAGLAMQSQDVLASIEAVLDKPVDIYPDGYEDEKRVVAVLPAFMMLVPLRASCLKLRGELSGWQMAEASNIRDMLQEAGPACSGRSALTASRSWMYECTALGPCCPRTSGTRPP
jgi:hypothetical protein